MADNDTAAQAQDDPKTQPASGAKTPVLETLPVGSFEAYVERRLLEAVNAPCTPAAPCRLCREHSRNLLDDAARLIIGQG
jgi:hypothetical protein